MAAGTAKRGGKRTPAATKKTAAKKTATSVKAAKKSTGAAEATVTAEARAAQADKIAAQVVDLRDNKEQSWAEIAETVSLDSGRVQQLYRIATMPPKLRIKFTDDEDLAAKLVAAREKGDEFAAWHWLAARSGVSQAKVKKLYDSVEGEGASKQGFSMIVNRSGSAEKATPKTTKAVKGATAKKGTVAKKGAATKTTARKRGGKRTPAADPS